MNTETDTKTVLDEIANRKPQVILNDEDQYIEIMEKDGTTLYEDYSYKAVDTPLKLLQLLYFLSGKTIFSVNLMKELITTCGDKFGFAVEPFDADPN